MAESEDNRRLYYDDDPLGAAMTLPIQPQDDPVWRQAQFERVRAAIQLGIDEADRGECAPLDSEEILREARAETTAARPGGPRLG